MKKTKTWLAAAMATVAVSVTVLAGGFLAPVSEPFAGPTVTWTNTTGQRMALSAIVGFGTSWSNTPNATIWLNNGAGAILLVQAAATNSIGWFDGAASLAVERAATITLNVSCSSILTNRYMLLFKQD